MKGWWRHTAIGMLAAGMVLALGVNPGMAQGRAHVYLLRGLMNIFSLGMDALADKLDRRGISTTVQNYASWQSLADQAAARYRAGTEGPIILIGHSLGADAVMEMATYLGRKGVPVALVVPFDCTASFSASANVARVINLTKHFYMSAGPGFHGSLVNVDLSRDPNIDHLNIDKSPRLHARVIGEVLAIVDSHHTSEPGLAAKPATAGTSAVSSVHDDKTGALGGADKPQGAQPAAAPAKTGQDPTNTVGAAKPSDGGTPVIALPERGAHPSGPLQ